jgi:predicted regulator of Ras-like GTPase activity (Roadblock/LC7/MglB family)
MKEILRELNSVAGIKGSMIVTRDGMVIASDLRGGLMEETIAAVSSRLLMAAEAHAEKMGLKDFTRLALEGTHGKIVVVRAGNASLVVIADMRMDPDASLIEIMSAARRIEAHGKLSMGGLARGASQPTRS